MSIRRAPGNMVQENVIIPVVLVHGGAGDFPDSGAQAKHAGVKKAAEEGYKLLTVNGGTVVDAVEAAVKVLEDNETFNAGHGSCLNINGDIEMDAIIMEGGGQKAGAVAAVKNIANPVSLARMVMDKTDHVLLAGDGANLFATEMGVEEVPQAKLKTEHAEENLEKFKKHGGFISELGSGPRHGTVGAVAVDSNGHVAVATSTGGMVGKKVGRVGDTPLVGCGAYCDDNIGAVSTTGHGESIMKSCLAYNIVQLMKQGKSPSTATMEALKAMTERFQETAGAIAVSNKGDIGFYFTSKKMSWAYQCGTCIRNGSDEVYVHEENCG